MKRPLVRFALAFAAALLALDAGANANAADQTLALQWENLIPSSEGLSEDLGRLLGIVEHGEMSQRDDSAEAYTNVVTNYNGKTVRLPGYMVPLDLGADGVTEFLLVPYYGACIHVPPPPPNQIVFVTTAEPYQMEALFEPVMVTGDFDVAAISTDLADVGYTIYADEIEPYEY